MGIMVFISCVSCCLLGMGSSVLLALMHVVGKCFTGCCL